MAKAPLEGVFQHIRKMVDAQTLAEATDEQLVERFARGHEEPAFAALLRRHGPMVLSVSHGILRQLEDAEDVFQATFLLLARKASSIRKRAAVASWLHGVAYRLAMKARAQRALRRSQEIKASAMRKTGPSVEQAWQELRPVLDEEMEKLPASYRTALILCYLEGKTHEEVARELGCPLGTVRSRVGRGRKLLQERLTRRGLTLSAGSFTAFLVAGTSSATLRAQLVDSTLKACLQFVTGRSAEALVSAPVAALVEGGLKAMLSTKLKIATALLLTVSFVAGAGALAHQVFEAKPSEIKQQTGPQRTIQRSNSRIQEQARTDQYGDPLPPGALARMGTVRFRHGDQINRVAFSPGGLTLASASNDGSVRLWDAATGKELRRFLGHQGAVISVACSPDGTMLASGGWEGDNTIRLWDVATGKELRLFKPQSGPWGCIVFSPDGKSLATGRHDHGIQLWDVETGKLLHQLDGQDKSSVPVEVAYSPDGRTLASGGKDGTIRMWDLATGKESRRLPGPQKNWNHIVAFSPDGRTIASAGHASPIRLLEVATGKEIRQLQAHPDGDSSLAFAPDGRTLACGDTTGTIHLWEAATGNELFRFKGHSGYVAGLSFSGDGQRLASIADATIHVWDVASRKEISPFAGHVSTLAFLTLSPDDQTVASVGNRDDRPIHLWNIATGKETRPPFGHAGDTKISFAPDAKSLASAGWDKAFRLWEIDTGKELRQFQVNHSVIITVAFCPDGQSIVSGGFDGVSRLWQVATGKELRQIGRLGDGLYGLDLSPDGKTLATVNRDKKVHLWELATGKELRQIPAQEDFDPSPAFSPDGNILAVADGWRRADSRILYHKIRLWDVAKGVQLRQFGDSRSFHSCLIFSPDGRTLASAGEDHLVHLWEVATGGERRRLAGHAGRVASLVFNRDGKTLISGSSDATALIWDVTGLRIHWQPTETHLPTKDLRGLWAALAEEDASKAYQAI